MSDRLIDSERLDVLREAVRPLIREGLVYRDDLESIVASASCVLDLQSNANAVGGIDGRRDQGESIDVQP